MRLLVSLLISLCTLSAFALDPVREYEFIPEDFGMEYEEMFIKTEDGTKLYAWKFLPLKKSMKTVVVSDDGNGNMADNFEIIGQFVSLGYNVISYDYRGYGQSEDFRINTRFYMYAQFAEDLDAVVRHVKKYDAKQQVTTFGVGIGGALSISVGCNNTKVSYAIADGPYTDLETMKKRQSEVNGKDYMMPLGFDKMFVEPLFAIADKGDNLDGIMIITGGADQLVKPDEIKEMVKPKKKLCTVYVVPGSKNEDNFTTNKNEYFNQIKAFIQG